MRISDWSSDVCSSDLGPAAGKRLIGNDRGLHQSWAPWITGAPAQASTRHQRRVEAPATRHNEGICPVGQLFANQLSANIGSVARKTGASPDMQNNTRKTIHSAPTTANALSPPP